MHLKGTRYTYRFVLGPETYTAAAWLEANRNQRVAGGVYVDFLAAPSPLIWQRTLAGGQIDRIMRAALGVDGLPFRAEFGNDERFYAARPWSLPMAVLGRKLWAGYHTAADTPDNCPDARWAEGASALRAIVQALEDDCCPLVDMPGPICRSRHGLYDDSLTMREHEAVEQLQFHADGQTPLVEIAHRTGASFGFLARWLGKFQAAGLAVAPAPARAPLADNPGFPAPECEEQRP
jgi:aminopeptidase-like protein